ncbi:MAG: hypothetical protein Q8L88_02425 [Bacteroidota bacterium]|nr:hypothetical protein [Bacteroidota bacterium]
MITLDVTQTKPPLGVIPRRIIDGERMSTLGAGMIRYYLCAKPIPLEWITEYNEIANRLSKVPDFVAGGIR